MGNSRSPPAPGRGEKVAPSSYPHIDDMEQHTDQSNYASPNMRNQLGGTMPRG